MYVLYWDTVKQIYGTHGIYAIKFPYFQNINIFVRKKRTGPVSYWIKK